VSKSRQLFGGKWSCRRFARCNHGYIEFNAFRVNAKRYPEETPMIATFNEMRPIANPATVQRAEVSAGMRIARYCWLEELPGLVFGILTIAYIVTSLTGLSP
jgi:hypothetical protein